MEVKAIRTGALREVSAFIDIDPDRNSPQGERLGLDLKPDECPVIAWSGGDEAAIKKQFAKLNRVLSDIPLGPNPAIKMKKTRNRRGLV
jgi:hypothetical protein